MRMVVLSLAALLITGCGVNGKWSLARVEPDAARRDVEFHSLRLDKDGSFYAEASEGTIKTTSGTYTFKDDVLELRAHDGERHSYDARLENSGNELVLESLWQGKKLVMRYERRED